MNRAVKPLSHEHDRQLAPAGGDDLHQPLEAIQRVAVDVVGLIDEQHDRLPGFSYHLLEQALAPFGLGGRFQVGVAGDVEKERHDQVWQRHPRFVDREAARDDDVLVGGDVVLQPVHHHGLAGPDGTADRHQAPGTDGRDHIVAELAQAVGLELSGVNPVPDDPEVAHGLSGQHSFVPFGLERNRSTMVLAISALSSVRWRSSEMKVRASASSAPSGLPSLSAMPWRASSSLR